MVRVDLLEENASTCQTDMFILITPAINLTFFEQFASLLYWPYTAQQTNDEKTASAISLCYSMIFYNECLASLLWFWV